LSTSRLPANRQKRIASVVTKHAKKKERPTWTQVNALFQSRSIVETVIRRQRN
jgi:hypothetical protein